MQKAIRILQLRIFEDEGEGSTFLQEVSPASPSPSPDKERARKMTVTSGLICLEDDLTKLGVWAARIYFTTEHPRDVNRILNDYLEPQPFDPGACTRGLYLRGVE